MDLNDILTTALESLGDKVRDDLRETVETIRTKRDVLETALGYARQQVLSALPDKLRKKFGREEIGFLFFLDFKDKAPDYADLVTDEVSQAVAKVIDCEEILEAFDEVSEKKKKKRPLSPRITKPAGQQARPRPPRASAPPPAPEVPATGIVFRQLGRTSPGGQIEKIILEELHLHGRFRNTAVFARQHDVIPEACLIVLRRLRKLGVIIMEGERKNTSYIFADPAPSRAQPTADKIPILATTNEHVSRDAIIEKAILEILHLNGQFRNTVQFRKKLDITYGQCLSVLKRLRDQGIILIESVGPRTYYVFKDPALRPKNIQPATPAAPPEAPQDIIEQFRECLTGQRFSVARITYDRNPADRRKQFDSVIIAVLRDYFDQLKKTSFERQNTDHILEKIAGLIQHFCLTSDRSGIDPSIIRTVALGAERDMDKELLNQLRSRLPEYFSSESPQAVPAPVPRPTMVARAASRPVTHGRIVQPAFVSEFLHEIERDNVPAARALYEHDYNRQDLLNEAALKLIQNRFALLTADDSPATIRRHCAAITNAADAIVAEEGQDGLPRRRLALQLHGLIAKLPAPLKERILEQLQNILEPAPARRAASARPTEESMRNHVADLVFDLKFTEAQKVNTDKQNFIKGVLMAVSRHLQFVAGRDEESNRHLHAVLSILKGTTSSVSSETTREALRIALSTMAENPSRYPKRLIDHIRFFLRQYL